jgi:hypothetical protein
LYSNQNTQVIWDKGSITEGLSWIIILKSTRVLLLLLSSGKDSTKVDRAKAVPILKPVVAVLHMSRVRMC